MLKNLKNTELTCKDIERVLSNSNLFDGADSDVWTVKGPIVEARRSSIYQGFHSNSPKPVCIKYSKSGERSKKSLILEYNNLQKYSSAMADNKRYGVPKPIACLPDSGMLVLEWVNGKSVKFHLRQGFYKRKSRKSLIVESAHWLKGFHLAAGASSKTFSPSQLADKIDNYALLNRISFQACKITALKVAEVFRRETEKVPVSQEVYSSVHGDFTPGNIIYSDGKMLGIDTTRQASASVIEDATRFITDLIVDKNIILVIIGIWVPFLKPWIRRDEKSFLHAYFGNEVEEKHKQIVLFLLFHMIKKMVQAAEIVAVHRQNKGFKSPFLLLYRYSRYWKRQLLIYELLQRLK